MQYNREAGCVFFLFFPVRVGASMSEDVITDHLYFERVVHLNYCFRNYLVVELEDGNVLLSLINSKDSP